MSRRAPPAKYRLSLKQLRGLTIAQRPALDQDGKTILVANPGRKPYRFSDGTPGAPLGFNIYVGVSGAFYEVRAKLKGEAIRISLGSVQLLEPQSAHALAIQHKQSFRDTGTDPRQHIQDIEAV